MKKLFFTALVAVVAVGGAYAQQYYQAQPESENGSAIHFDCVGDVNPLCGASTYLADTDTLASSEIQESTKVELP